MFTLNPGTYPPLLLTWYRQAQSFGACTEGEEERHEDSWRREHERSEGVQRVTEGTRTMSHLCPGQAQLADNLSPTLSGVLPSLSTQVHVTPYRYPEDYCPPSNKFSAFFKSCLPISSSLPTPNPNPNPNSRLDVPHTLLSF